MKITPLMILVMFAFSPFILIGLLAYLVWAFLRAGWWCGKDLIDMM
jgi:hypothetical protein